MRVVGSPKTSAVMCVAPMSGARTAAVLASGDCVGFAGAETMQMVLSLNWNSVAGELVVVAVADPLIGSVRTFTTDGVDRFQPFVWPGFVEFDDVNGLTVVVTHDHNCSVWGMDDYAKRLELQGTLDVKQGGGCLMCVYPDRLDLLSADTLRTLWSLPCDTRSYELLEQLSDDRLLTKSPGEEAELIDPKRSTRYTMPGTRTLVAGQFVFINSLLRVVCFFEDGAVLYSGRGEPLARWDVTPGGVSMLGTRDLLYYASGVDLWAIDVKAMRLMGHLALPNRASCCNYDTQSEELVVGTTGGAILRCTIEGQRAESWRRNSGSASQA